MSNTDNIEDHVSDEKPKSLNKSYSLIRMTTENSDLYRTNSKMILVTRDPVYTNKTIVQGHYIGPKPHNYLPLAIFVTIINPLLGPISIMLSVMSNRAYAQGDTKYALKWSLNSFFWSVISIVVAIVVYIAIGFSIRIFILIILKIPHQVVTTGHRQSLDIPLITVNVYN